jgi:hypothetical protein
LNRRPQRPERCALAKLRYSPMLPYSTAADLGCQLETRMPQESPAALSALETSPLEEGLVALALFRFSIAGRRRNRLLEQLAGQITDRHPAAVVLRLQHFLHPLAFSVSLHLLD